MFREGWIKVNSVPFHVWTWGGWIEDDISSDSVLLFITGNPGITDFYFSFMEKLYNLIGIPTWIVSLAGVEPLPPGMTQPSIDQNPELYNVSGQISHKREFIKKYVGKDKKLFLCGHSLGGKITVELMKDKEIISKVSQVYLICPTLQHIQETPNGVFFTRYIQHFIPLIVFFAWLFSLLPLAFRRIVLSSYVKTRRDWDKCHKETCLVGILKLFTAEGSKSSLFLAKDEMHEIKGLDTEIYENYHNIIRCYFVPDDSWAPICQLENLLEKHPKVNGVILENGATHCFSLTAPMEMAEELAKEIVPLIKG